MTQVGSFEALGDLYQDVILDHGRNPRHAHRLEPFDASAKGDNPMCGDRIRIWVKFDFGLIARLGFEARGCAISIASADLMAEIVEGIAKSEIPILFDAFSAMARTGSCPCCDASLVRPMKRLSVLSGVHEYPSRIKCATLPWHALLAALNGSEGASSE
jgi:nitrogen fixation NifU-like protein